MNNAIQAIQNAYDLLQNLTVSNIKNALVRSGVFLVALVLIAIGFMAVAGQSQ